MYEIKNQNNKWNRLKILAGLMVTVFVVTLALVIANRLSDESLAVLAGAACGVGAAIPTSLFIVAVSRRRDEAAPQRTPTQGAYPPVVVVAPPGTQQRANAWNTLSTLNAPPQRQFTVVGEPSLDVDDRT